MVTVFLNKVWMDSDLSGLVMFKAVVCYFEEFVMFYGVNPRTGDFNPAIGLVYNLPETKPWSDLLHTCSADDSINKYSILP